MFKLLYGAVNAPLKTRINVRYPYPYTKDLIKIIRTSGNYRELLGVAYDILAIMDDDNPGKPIAMVCGPISTGGRNSRKENLAIFSKAIERVTSSGLLVFNQMPFEDDMDRIYKSNPVLQGLTLLEEFYKPIFESGYIKLLCFLTGWENSIGAKWEYNYAQKLEIPTLYISEHYTND